MCYDKWKLKEEKINVLKFLSFSNVSSGLHMRNNNEWKDDELI